MASHSFQQKVVSFAHLMWRRTRYRRILYFILMVIAWIAIVPPVYLTYLKEGGKDASLKSVTNPSPLQTPDYVEITMVAQEVNLVKHKLKFYVSTTPFGKYQANHQELAEGMQAYYGFQNVEYPKGKKMQAVDISVPILGYPRLFPFDTYGADFEVSLSAAAGNNTDVEAENIPVRLVVYGEAQSLTIKSKLNVYRDYPNMIVVDVQVQRASTTLIFCIFLMLVMWGLALTMVLLSFQILVERRQVAPNLTIIGVTMMFALPALRNSQPGVPTLGCASDILTFFWCLFMIAVTAIVNILSLVLRWKYRPASTLTSSETKTPDAPSYPTYPPDLATSQATPGDSSLPIHHRFSAASSSSTLPVTPNAPYPPPTSMRHNEHMPPSDEMSSYYQHIRKYAGNNDLENSHQR